MTPKLNTLTTLLLLEKLMPSFLMFQPSASHHTHALSLYSLVIIPGKGFDGSGSKVVEKENAATQRGKDIMQTGKANFTSLVYPGLYRPLFSKIQG